MHVGGECNTGLGELIIIKYRYYKQSTGLRVISEENNFTSSVQFVLRKIWAKKLWTRPKLVLDKINFCDTSVLHALCSNLVAEMEAKSP
jgi:hypothetical protein